MNVWNKYPNYNEQELATLTKAACQVLMASGGDEVAEIETLDLPPRVAAREVADILRESVHGITANAIQQLLENGTVSSDLALQILGVLREQSDLAELIAIEYEQATKRMAGVEVLLAAALLVLACKIRKFKLGKEGVEITFAPLSKKITDLLSLLLPKG
jgi:hypothetical protein